MSPISISIHAPTRGATVSDYAQNAITKISIHAPTRGATANRLGGYKAYAHISIHAPTRGATVNGMDYDGLVVNFNPRSHERSDPVG